MADIPGGQGPTDNGLVDCANVMVTPLVQHWTSNGGGIQKMRAFLNSFGNTDSAYNGTAQSDCALWLLDDATFSPNRQKLLAGLISRGLDVWWMTKNASWVRWEQSGGQGAGRGVSFAVLAATLLEDLRIRDDVAGLETERFGDFGYYLSRSANGGTYPQDADQLGFPLWGSYCPHNEAAPGNPNETTNSTDYYGGQDNGDCRDPCDQGWIDGGGTGEDTDESSGCGGSPAGTFDGSPYGYSLSAPTAFFAMGWLLPQFQQFYGGTRKLTDPNDVNASTLLAAFHFLDRYEDYDGAGWDRTNLNSDITNYTGGNWCAPDTSADLSSCSGTNGRFTGDHEFKTTGIYKGAGDWIYGAANLRRCGYPVNFGSSPCTTYKGLTCNDGTGGTPYCLGPDCPAGCPDVDSDGWTDYADPCPRHADSTPDDPDFDGVDSTCDQCANDASCAYGSLSVTKEGPGFVGAFIHNNIYCGDVELPQYEDCYQDEIAATYGVSINAFPTSGQEADFEGWVGCTVNSQQWVDDHMYGVVTVPANGVHCRAIFVEE